MTTHDETGCYVIRVKGGITMTVAHCDDAEIAEQIADALRTIAQQPKDSAEVGGC